MVGTEEWPSIVASVVHTLNGPTIKIPQKCAPPPSPPTPFPCSFYASLSCCCCCWAIPSSIAPKCHPPQTMVRHSRETHSLPLSNWRNTNTTRLATTRCQRLDVPRRAISYTLFNAYLAVAFYIHMLTRKVFAPIIMYRKENTERVMLVW